MWCKNSNVFFYHILSLTERDLLRFFLRKNGSYYELEKLTVIAKCGFCTIKAGFVNFVSKVFVSD